MFMLLGFVFCLVLRFWEVLLFFKMFKMFVLSGDLFVCMIKVWECVVGLFVDKFLCIWWEIVEEVVVSFVVVVGMIKFGVFWEVDCFVDLLFLFFNLDYF